MVGYIVKSGNYDFKELGILRVNVKVNARRVSARWKGGAIVVTAPMNIEYDELLRIIRGFASRLEEIRPDSLYQIGQKFDFGEFRVELRGQSYQPDKIFANFDQGRGTIDIGNDWDINKPNTIKQISKFICRMAQIAAPKALIPRANELSKKVDKAPLMWTISNGHRVLGHCNAQGVIALSYVLMFYPQHLRDYVIYHELAHLSEMNHSPRFHEICDSYCSGKEKELVAELKKFRLPIVI